MPDLKPFPGTSATEQTIAAVVHAAIFDVALVAAEADAIAAIPFLGWPVVRDVFHYCFVKILTAVYDRLGKVIVFAMIDLQTQAELAAYQSAVDDLKKKTGSADEQAAIDEFKRRLGDLVHYPMPAV